MPKIEFETEKIKPVGELFKSIPEDAVAIWSGEHLLWWRDNASGYTKHMGSAGVYTKEEAFRLTRHTSPEKKIEIKPHPYAGCDIYVATSDGSIPRKFKETICIGSYKMEIEYELSGEGCLVVKHISGEKK